MKLTKQQLKKIILDETKKYLGKINEGEDLMSIGEPGAAFQTAVDECKNMWEAAYDQNDPSMAAQGEQAWSMQVNAACEELERKIQKVFFEVEDDLMNGDFS